MNFSLKNFIFGLGSGIVATSLVFYCVYSFSLRHYIAAEPAQTDVAAGQDPAGGTGQDPVLAGEDPGTPEPVTGQLASRQPIGKTPSPSGQPASETPASETPGTDTPPTEETPSGGREQSSPQADVLVVFEKGMVAAEFAELLEENGVVDDAAAFRAFIADNGMTGRLDSGAFYLPRNGTYEDVLDIISRAYKRP